MYIYEMPYRSRQRLVDVLNVNDAWRELAGTQMGYNQIDLDKFRRAGYRQGESPADALLSCWGQKNHTVAELFKHLYKIKHFQAMDAIKECVDSKFHKYIQYGCPGAAYNPTMSMTMQSSSQACGIPYPPKTYQRTTKRDENLFENLVETEKWEPKKILPETGNFQNSQYPAGETRRIPGSSKVDLMTMDNNEVHGAGQITVLTPNQAPAPTRPVNSGPPTAEGRDLLTPLNIVAMPGSHNQGGAATYLGNSPGVSGNPTSMGTRTGEPSWSILKQRNNSGIPVSDPDVMLRMVPFSELAQACNNFSHENILGRGGFGEVYRGRWNGQDVAVKRIREDRRTKNDSGFQKYVNQAITELQALHTFPAENILPLLAFHYVDTMEMTDPCLVYQYMPNGSVTDRLRCKDGTPPLDWSTRGNIALGTARGLCHLHANKIIHGDIKGPNILLDKHFEPKIGDFGLARGGPESDEYSYKIVSSVQGTASYLPDDYVRSRHLTAAVDTFCYGIFLFELVTGKSPSWHPPGDNTRLRDIMLEALTPGEWVDKSSKEEVNPWPNCLFFLGRDCAKANRKSRPEMSHVLFALEQLQKSPSSLAIQGYYDMRNAPVSNALSSTSIDLLSHQQQYNQNGSNKRAQNIPVILENDERLSSSSRDRYVQVPVSDPKQQHQQEQPQQPSSESIPPQIHFAEQTQGADRCPLVLENPGSGFFLAHHYTSGGQGLSSQSLPLVLNDEPGSQTSQSFQVASEEQSYSGSKTMSQSVEPSFVLDEPSLPMLSNHLRLLSVGMQQQPSQLNNHNATKPVQSQPLQKGPSPTDEVVPNFDSLLASSAEIPAVLFNLDDVPTLPDVMILDGDDSLANNRLLSAELGAEQAAAFGLF